MPELPEVETVRSQLARPLAGRFIRGVTVLWSRTLGATGGERFAEHLVGARIGTAQRHGKLLLFPLQRGQKDAGVFHAHLRMTGRFLVRECGATTGLWDRVLVHLDGDEELVFLDVRKFGRLGIASSCAKAIETLGPDAWHAALDGAALATLLGGRRTALKSTLLDQSVLAGLGNIYVDESLHRAKLHPLRRAGSLADKECAKLAQVIHHVLERAISRSGSSFDAFYRTPEGKPGDFQSEFRVYGRHGKRCRGCPDTIRRAVLGQRGTWWCPSCQPSPRRSEMASARFRR